MNSTIPAKDHANALGRRDADRARLVDRTGVADFHTGVGGDGAQGLQLREALRRDIRLLVRELHLHDRRGFIGGDGVRRVLAEWRARVVDSRDLGRARHELVDRRTVGLGRHLRAIRYRHHDLSAGAGGRREDGCESVDGVLRLCARDREGVVGLAAQRPAAPEDADHEDQPDGEHAPRMTERKPTESVKEGGHELLRLFGGTDGNGREQFAHDRDESGPDLIDGFVAERLRL